MKRINTILVAGALGIFATGPVAAQNGASPAHGAADIVETAKAAGSFGTLIAAVEVAGLAETLKGDGPFTVFAPTDEAFRKLPEGTVDDLLKPENRERLRAILLYHVVPGRMPASDVTGRSSLTTVEGSELPVRVERGAVWVGDAKVVSPNVAATNGVIHVIDSVLLPE